MLARFAIRHPVTVAVLCAAAVLMGAVALRSLPIDLLPELDAPRIAVLVTSGDRPPDELEDAYARPLENALSTLPGVTSVRTITTVGRVLATVEYEWSADLDFALLDVQKQVAPLATDRDVESLVVRRFDPNAEPIVVVALTEEDGAGDLDALRRLADDRIARSLERVPGVASVQVAGGRRREVTVTVDPHRLSAYGLTTDRLAGLLAQSNAEASGGTVEDRGRVHVIKGIGRFETLEDVASLPLPLARAGQTTAGAPLVLSDVADVAWEDAPLRGLVAVGNREGVSLSIYKEAGENTVEVSDRVGEALAALSADLRGLEASVVRDQADFIRTAIAEVRTAALLGSVLAIAVLALFLRHAGATFLIALAIPISIVATFAVMPAAGLTLNLMTLGGLALGAGMLVDNAIVVIEAIFRRLEEGEDPAAAAEHGTSEVGGAILASTLTHVVVFVPVVFLEGLAAKLFFGLAATVSISLLCSLAVAFLVVPAAAARMFTRESVRRAREESAWISGYVETLRGVLDRKGAILVATAALVAAAVVVVPTLPREFLPSADSGEVTARLLMPEGTRATVTGEAAARLVSTLEATLPGVVQASVAEIGEAVREEATLTEDVPSENRGVLRLRLVPPAEREVASDRVIDVLDRASEQVEGLVLRFDPSDAVLGRVLQSGPPVRVELRGQDPVALERATRAAAEAVAALPELFDVHSSFEDRRAEVRLELDRVLAAGLGFTPDTLARQLRQRLGAEAATTFRQGDEERDVTLRAPSQSLETLPHLLLDAPSGERVRLGDIAKVEVVSAPTSIQRSLGARLGVVTAQVASGASLGPAAARAVAAVEALDLPAGVRVQVGGAEAQRRASFSQLVFAAILGIVLVYMVMASLFESLVHPFTILFTLPTAAVGVVGALAAAGHGISVASLLGAEMLAGIAVSNGILLVDVTGQLRARGLARREALLEAARLRVRPILMTSLTTILGMVPMALEIGEGSGLRAPLAIAVSGGLLTSTLLTLVVVPVAYDLLDRLRPGWAREDARRAGS